MCVVDLVLEFAAIATAGPAVPSGSIELVAERSIAKPAIEPVLGCPYVAAVQIDYAAPYQA